MPFKVGIAGTHSTGKTTFVERLEQAFLREGIQTARVRDLASKARDIGFPILREHTFESTLWVITHGISRELEEGLTAPVVIVDRPVPDALGYLFAALEHREASLPAEQRAFLVSLSEGHSQSYNVLFRTVLNEGIAIDRTKDRDFDEAYRRRCAAHIQQVFNAQNIGYTALTLDGHAAGVDQVLSAYRASTATA